MFLLLASPGLTWAQGVRFDNPGGSAQRIVQGFLAPIPGAQITVCTSSGTGAPCSPIVPTSPVTLCTDASCSTAAPNPFTADASGNFGGWLQPGTYKISVTATGVTGYLLTLVVPPGAASNIAFTGQISFSQPITSTVSTGTAPFSIASTTIVPNLNAALLGGLTAPASAILGLTDTQSPTNKTFNVQSNTFTENTPAAGNYFRDNGTSFQPSAIQAGDLPASTSQCTGVQLAKGINSGNVTNCVTPPTFVASGAAHAVGYVPDPGSSAGTTRFLREDATWAAPSNASAVFVGGCNGTASAGSTLTLFGLGNFSALTCTQSGVAGSIPMPSSGTLKNLRVVAVSGGVNASSGVVTIMDNGVSTGITCTLGTGTTCNDTTHTASVAAGDLILVQFTTQGAETLAGIRVTVEKQ